MEIVKKCGDRAAFCALLFYVVVAGLLLKVVILSPGLLIGEDHAPPLTAIQIHSLFNMGQFAWDFNNFIAYRSFSTGAAFFVQWAEYVLSLAGISGETFTKLFLVSIVAFAGFSMHVLLRYLKLNVFVAVFGGLFYMTTPMVFNYLIMGWHFVVLTMGLLPLAVVCFMESVRKDNIRYALVTGIIYAASFIQSQNLIWFPLVFLGLFFCLVSNRASAWIYMKMLALVLFLFVALNVHVILGLLVFPHHAVSGSDYIMAPASLGAMAHFYPVNILRLWGGLFNYQYEKILSEFGWSELSYVTPIFAAGALLLEKDKRLVRSFWLIALIPFGMYCLNFNRALLLNIPFSNLVRDFARFTVMSVFAYSVLISLTLERIVEGCAPGSADRVCV